MFQSSKLNGNGEIVTTPLDYYLNASDPQQRKGFISWDEKTTAKLHWRGSTTGDWYTHRENYNWRNSHRMRLHKLTHAEKGTRDIYVKSRRTGGWEMQTWEAGKVNKAYMDVGLVAGAIQVGSGVCRGTHHSAIRKMGHVRRSKQRSTGVRVWILRRRPSSNVGGETVYKLKLTTDIFDGGLRDQVLSSR